MGGLALTRENALVFIASSSWSWAALCAIERAAASAPRARSSRGGVARRRRDRARCRSPRATAYVGGGFYVTTSQFGPNFTSATTRRPTAPYQSLRFGRGAPEYERQDATELAETALGRTLSPAEVSSFWIDKALEFITGRPGAWLTLMARKVALLANATEMVDTESQETHAEWSWPLRIGGWFGHFGVLVPPRRSRRRPHLAAASAAWGSV